jgi:hypothetical protein
MFLDWFSLTGLIAFLGIAAVLFYFCRSGGCRR